MKRIQNEDELRALVSVTRSIRGYLTQPDTIQLPRKNWLSQKFLGNKKEEVLLHSQQERDAAFRDLENLMQVAVTILLGENTDTSTFNTEVTTLRTKYPFSYAVSYISQIHQSVMEIDITRYRVHTGKEDLINYYWYGVNSMPFAPSELTDTDKIFAPLSTDYIVARMYWEVLSREQANIPRLFPIAWMPYMQEAALSSEALQVLQELPGRVFVMVDKDVTGTTSGGIHNILERMFEGQKVYSGRKQPRESS